MKKSLRTAGIGAVLALALTAVGISPAVAATDTTGTVKITVTAPGGAPLPDVNLSVEPVEVSDGTLNQWDYGTTDASGVHTTSELAPGTYDVTAQLWWPVDSKKTVRITVTANKDSAETIALTGIQVVKGTVKAKGKAVTSGTVSIFNDGTSSYYTATITKGTYSQVVKPGSYTVQAYPPQGAAWVTTYAGSTVRQVESKKVKATTKPVTVNINAYDKLGKISGRVLDSKGKVAKNVSVYASANNRAGYSWAQTDSGGKFTLTGLPADTYYVSSGTTNSNGVLTKVKVKANATTKNVTVKLKKLPTYKGKVILTLKAPKALVKSGWACATLLGPKGTWTSSGCATTKNNKITFDGLPAGKYTLALNGANTAKSVTVKKNKTTKTSMTRAAGTTLSGKITNSKGKALAKSWVYVRDSYDTGLQSVQTDSKGKYKVSGVVKGKYTVQAYPAKPSQGANTSKSVTLTGKKATVNVKLIKSATITGKVVNTKGKPVAGVQVTVGTGPGWATATTDSKGKYKLTGLVPGTYSVATYDPYTGGYFNGKSAKKSLATGKTITVANIKIKN